MNERKVLPSLLILQKCVTSTAWCLYILVCAQFVYTCMHVLCHEILLFISDNVSHKKKCSTTDGKGELKSNESATKRPKRTNVNKGKLPLNVF